MVKTLNGEHRCIRPLENKNPNANTKWISDKLKELLAANPNMSYKLMEKEMTEKWGAEVPRWQLYRARILANEGNEGSHTESFKFLKKYMENLKSVRGRMTVSRLRLT